MAFQVEKPRLRKQKQRQPREDLRLRRVALGISQATIANMLGYSPTSVAYVENGIGSCTKAVVAAYERLLEYLEQGRGARKAKTEQDFSGVCPVCKKDYARRDIDYATYFTERRLLCPHCQAPIGYRRKEYRE